MAGSSFGAEPVVQVGADAPRAVSEPKARQSKAQVLIDAEGRNLLTLIARGLEGRSDFGVHVDCLCGGQLHVGNLLARTVQASVDRS